MKHLLLSILMLFPIVASTQVKLTINVETAGTLPQLISTDEKYQVEELYLSGELNGTDIHYIRDMAGVNMDKMEDEFIYNETVTNGQLRVLDISNAKIVEGGRNYYKLLTSSAKKTWSYYCYTKNNEISERMFWDCVTLEELILPNSITLIQTPLFYNHLYREKTRKMKLKCVKIADGNAKYDSRDNCNALIDTDLNTVIAGGANSSIPSNVISIGDNAFNFCSSLTTLNIPNNVTSIGNNAFQGCSGLTTLNIPNNVTSIGNNAFQDCSGLTILNIPDNITTIGDNTFYDCSSLTCINIPDNVTSIGNSAFRGCSHLTSINIPNKVISLGANVFSGCTSLNSITIPNSVTSIGTYAFQGCSSLNSIIVDSDNPNFDSRKNCNAIIDNNNQLILGCKNTIIPNSVTSIGNSAFCNCSGLTSLIIPDNVTSIGENAFYGCSGLTSLIIPDNVTSIGENAFYGCSGLTSINIPNNVTSIKSGTFNWCTGLTYITLPINLTTISNWAFGSCSSLTDVYCKAENTPFAEKNAFYNYDNITLYIPSASLETYKSTEPWSQFKAYQALLKKDLEATEKCSKPTISIVDGKFVFSSDTSGVIYRWSISTPNGSNGNSSSAISLPIILNVYASKPGYLNSDVATYEFNGLVGDVDGNGKVNVADHVELSKIIMAQ